MAGALLYVSTDLQFVAELSDLCGEIFDPVFRIAYLAFRQNPARCSSEIIPVKAVFLYAALNTLHKIREILFSVHVVPGQKLGLF